MSIYQKQIESERLNNEVEAWALKNQITVLPMGFSNYPDGRLPRAKENHADKELTEAESLERIELINQRVRELQARKEERWKQKEQARAEARVQRACEERADERANIGAF